MAAAICSNAIWSIYLWSGEENMIFPWNKAIYYDPKGPWDFMPPDHRPDGQKPLHDDWKMLRQIPRAFTSFIFLGAYMLEGNQNHWFEWKGHKYPKPWPEAPGKWQKTIVQFEDPVTSELISERYYARCLSNGLAYRIGPRISDDLENGIGYVYVDWIPIKTLKFLTFGTKKIVHHA